jgi:hypothetical protein
MEYLIRLIVTNKNRSKNASTQEHNQLQVTQHGNCKNLL